MAVSSPYHESEGDLTSSKLEVARVRGGENLTKVMGLVDRPSPFPFYLKGLVDRHSSLGARCRNSY